MTSMLSRTVRAGWRVAAIFVALAGGRATLWAQEGAAPLVRGVVFDSVAMRPLRGAQVQLVALPLRGAPRQVPTDSTGAFAFDSLTLGAYLLGFTHPRLDSLGYEASLVRVDLRKQGTLVAPLAVPSTRTLLRATCKGDVLRDSTGILRGYARSARDGMPIPHARVRIEWPEYVLARGAMQHETRVLGITTNDAGRFLVCGVPLGLTVLARAYAGPDSSGVLELELPEEGLLSRDLFVGDASHTVDFFERASSDATYTPKAALRDSTATDSTSGSPADTSTTTGARDGDRPRIRGVIRSTDGTGVAGARVQLLGSVSSTTTADDGTFTLGAVASGTQMLEGRAIGFHPAKIAVDVMGSGEVLATLTLVPVDDGIASTSTRLDTLRVNGLSRLSLGALEIRQGFARRAQAGVGIFFTDSVIRARAPHLPSELLRGTPGLTVTSGSGGQGVYMRASATFNATKGLCLPTVFLDGARAPRAPVDQMAIVSDIRAIEVYPRSEQAPTQFQTSDGCGSIVIWTRTLWDASRRPPPDRR